MKLDDERYANLQQLLAQSDPDLLVTELFRDPGGWIPYLLRAVSEADGDATRKTLVALNSALAPASARSVLEVSPDQILVAYLPFVTPNSPFSLEAICGISMLGESATAAADHLFSVAISPDANGRLEAVELLAKIGDKRASQFVELLADALSTPEEEVRHIPLSAICYLGPGARPTLPALHRALKSATEETQSHVLLAIEMVAV